MGEDDHEEKAKHYDNAEQADRVADELEKVHDDVLSAEAEADLEEAKASVESLGKEERDRAYTGDDDGADD